MRNTIVRLYNNSMNYRGSTSSWVGGLTLYRLCLSSIALDNCDYTLGYYSMELRPIDLCCRVYYATIGAYSANSLYTCLQSIGTESYFFYVGIL